MTRFRPKDFFHVQEVRPHTNFRAFYGFDGLLESLYWHIDNHTEFRNAYEIHTGANITQEGVRTPFEIYPGIFVPAGNYSHVEAQPVLLTNQGAPVSLEIRGRIGGFFGGHRVQLTPTLRLRAGDNLTGEVAYERND